MALVHDQLVPFVSLDPTMKELYACGMSIAVVAFELWDINNRPELSVLLLWKLANTNTSPNGGSKRELSPLLAINLNLSPIFLRSPVRLSVTVRTTDRRSTMGSISRRVSIAWPPAPPVEPTSTLVLTAPSKTFIDIRLLLPSPSSSLNDPPSPSELPDGTTLYWAFAGTSSHDSLTNHAKWTHSVDSRYPNPSDVVDSGQFETLKNGDTLERGTMRGLDNGEVKPYQEVWRDEVVSGAECIVLALNNTTEVVRVVGVVVRLGDWCQGILRDEEKVTVERWYQRRLVFRHGDGRLPCSLAFDSRSDEPTSFSKQGWKYVLE